MPPWGVLNASECGTRSKVGPKWARWLQNPSRPAPQRFITRDKIRSSPILRRWGVQPRGRAGKKSPRRRNFNPVGGAQMLRLKKRTPKVEKVPGRVGCFWGPKFQSSRGGGTSVAVEKKTPKVEKVPGWVVCFWGQLLGLKNCMAHT